MLNITRMVDNTAQQDSDLRSEHGLAAWSETCRRTRVFVRELASEIRGDAGIYPIKALQSGLIRIQHGELEQPNAVIQTAR